MILSKVNNIIIYILPKYVVIIIYNTRNYRE